MKSRRASIIAVGTELTTGQILNRNAAWIAEKLSPLGLEVAIHLTVPDDRKLITEALDHCARESAYVFVTGGLGPTSDDFTREVIADWAGAPLEFKEPSWTKIVERLTRLGIPVAESNRQQCFFPRGAEVLPNAQGTADGFSLKKGAALLWVLPGPPNEIAAIWDTGAIERTIRATLPGDVVLLKLFTWQCLGKSESELGEIVERALHGSGLQTGYRAHRPIVEVKVWCAENQIARSAPWITKLESAIGAWVISRQGEDTAARLLRSVPSEEVEILDCATGGALAKRLGDALLTPEFRALASGFSLLTEWEGTAAPEDWVRSTLDDAEPEILTLVLGGFGENGMIALGLKHGDSTRVETFTAPFYHREQLERARLFAVEFAIKKWGDWLREETRH